MILAWICLALSQLAPGTFSVTVYLKTLSTEFLLAFPKFNDPSITLLIYTHAESITVTLSLTNPGNSTHNKVAEISVEKSKPASYLLHKDQLGMPSKEYSHHRCLLLTSDEPFGIHVHMHEGVHSLSSFMAVPVQAFGRVYVAVTHRLRPFLTVVSQKKTKIFVSLNIYPFTDLIADGSYKPVGSHNWRTILLESYEAFSLAKCLDTSYLTDISLTGSRIESCHPIGVISGSCSLIQDDCNTPDKAFPYPDMASEMLLSAKTFGRKFVIVYSRQRSNKDFIWIVFTQPKTTATVYIQDVAHPVYLEKPGTQRLNSVTPEGYVVSDKPIAVFYYVTTTCQSSGDKGGPSILMIVPNHLFFNLYAWVTPPGENVVSFISLVVPSASKVEDVKWSNGSIPYVNMTKDKGSVKSNFSIFTFELESASGDAFLEATFNFGCYFSGFSKGSFFQVAGFYFRDTKDACKPSPQRDEDGKDNDCDGIVDEEYKNEIDDDGDGLVDEDTYKNSDTNQFGRWGRGCHFGCSDYCVANCSSETGACFNCLEGRMNKANFCLNALTGAAEGESFLLAFPELYSPKIYLLIYTMADHAAVTISITKRGSTEHRKLVELSVSRSRTAQHRLDGYKIPTPPREYSRHKCLLLTSNQAFGVHVHMYDGSQTMSSFLAIPVQAFGTFYSVITHKKRPFLTVMSAQKTKVFISVKILPDNTLVVDGAERLVGKHNYRSIQLDSYQAFSLIKCSESSYLNGISLTGTRIMSLQPVGVISGSCSLIHDECKNPEKAVTYPDMSSEMLLPEKSYGQNFVLVSPHKRSNNDFFTVIASAPNTQINLNNGIKDYPSFLEKTADFLQLRVEREKASNGFLTSNKPVAVYSFIVSPCQKTSDKGGPSIMTIVPSEIFYNIYVWVKPPIDVKNFLSLVLPASSKPEDVLWNRSPIPYVDKVVDDNITKSTFIIVTMEIETSDSLAILSSTNNYGCYFSGLAKRSFFSGAIEGTFFQMAGFSYDSEKYKCDKSDVQEKDDGKDNDCDGHIDEEAMNQLDDDRDGLIDEDTFGNPDCSEYGRWGKNCIYGCPEFCSDDCDKSSGQCFGCVNGYTQPGCFCLTACPKFTYGTNCTGNCRAKCGDSDCFEQFTGACETLNRHYISFWRRRSWLFWLLLASLLIAVLILYLVSRLKCKCTKEDQLTELTEADQLEEFDPMLGSSVEGTVNPAAEKRGTVNPAADKPGTVHVAADKPGTVHVAADKPGTVHVAADKPGTVNPAADKKGRVHPAAEKPTAVLGVVEKAQIKSKCQDMREMMGASVDEPDECNEDYIQKTSLMKGGKYYPVTTKNWFSFFGITKSKKPD